MTQATNESEGGNTPEERVDRSVETFSPAALRAARRRRRWTLSDLADLAHVSVASVSAWERGAAKPTVPNLVAVAAVLQVLVADLVAPTRGDPTLFDYRLAGGLTITDVAHQAGLSTSTVSRAENGLGPISGRVAAALAGVYDVDSTVIEAAHALAQKKRLARLRTH